MQSADLSAFPMQSQSWKLALKTTKQQNETEKNLKIHKKKIQSHKAETLTQSLNQESTH